MFVSLLPNYVAFEQFCEYVRKDHVGSYAKQILIYYDFCRIYQLDFQPSYNVRIGDQLNCLTMTSLNLLLEII